MVEKIYSNNTCPKQDNIGLFMDFGKGLGIKSDDMEPQDLRVIKRRKVEDENIQGSYPSVFSEAEQRFRNAEFTAKEISQQLNKVNPVQNVYYQTSLTNLLSETFAKAPLQKQKSKGLRVVSNVPSWSQAQLQEAIESVITQKLRFTQASSKYGIPKGTLYDNILGKTKRMNILDTVGLTGSQEQLVLEFCCEVSSMPYNRRTSCTLKNVTLFITSLKRKEGNEEFHLSKREAFRWWWAFTKKHNIISLHYEHEDCHPGKLQRPQAKLAAQENIVHLINCTNTIPISIPTFTKQSFPLPFF
jgi:hypothetical protein